MSALDTQSIPGTDPDNDGVHKRTLAHVKKLAERLVRRSPLSVVSEVRPWSELVLAGTSRAVEVESTLQNAHKTLEEDRVAVNQSNLMHASHVGRVRLNEATSVPYQHQIPHEPTVGYSLLC